MVLRRHLPEIKKIPRLLLRFWLSYVALVALLVVIIGIPLGFGTFRLLSEEAYATAESDLLSFSQSISTRLKEMDRITVQINDNQRLIPYFLASGGIYARDAVNELVKIRRSNDFIYDVAVYFTPDTSIGNEQGMFYAASGIYEPEMFFNDFYRYESWNLSLFRQDVSGFTHSTMRPLEKIWLNKNYSERFLTYICPLLSNMPSNNRGVVLFLINEDRLNELIDNSSLHKNGMTSLHDANGRLLFAANRLALKVDSTDIFAQLQDTEALQPGLRDVTLFHEAFKQVTIRSTYNQWSYSGILPKSLLLRKVYANLEVLLYIFITAMVIGFILSYRLSVTSYSPIRNLRRKLAGQPEESGKIDDLMLISNTMDDLARNNDNLILKLKSQQLLVRIQVLQNLLNNRFPSPGDAEAALKDADVTFNYPDLVVLAFAIDDYAAFINGNEKAMQDLLRFAMLNVIEELSDRQGCQGYGIDSLMPNKIILLLNYDGSLYQANLFDEISQQFMQFFQQNFKRSFTVGIGQPCSSLQQVPLSYAQAVTALREAFVIGKGIVIRAGQQTLPVLTKYWYPVEDENLLLNAIRQGNAVDAETALKMLVDHLLEKKLAVESVKSVLATLIHRIQVLLADMRISPARDAAALAELNQDTIWEWQDQMIEIIWQACRDSQMIKESHNFRLKDQLIEFIQANYQRNDLSLQLFAAKFDLSMGYITRFFKNQTGQPLMLYLDQVRLQHARQMLEETTLTLQEIIRRCGYLDETNFIRKFKRYYGQTPMQYRRGCQLAQPKSNS